MSGVAAVIYKLSHSTALLAEVPAARIKAGDLPLKTVLPAIGVKQISSVPRVNVDMVTTGTLHTDRVQVTVMVKDSEADGSGYPVLRSILRLVLAACPMTRGTVGSVSVDSILPDIEGPDLPGDAADILTGSRDFIVRYTI